MAVTGRMSVFGGGEGMDGKLVEQIVPKKLTAAEITLQVLIATVTVLIIAIMAITSLLFLMIPALAGVIVLAAFLILRLRVEFEYTMLENDLTIDRIRNRSSRQLVVWADVRSFDILARVDGPQFARYQHVETVYDASSGKDAPGRWFAVFSDQKGDGKTLLIFEPNARMQDALGKRVSRGVMQK